MRRIKRGDIFYASLDPVLGSERRGNRPLSIIQNNYGNMYSPTTTVAPITKQRWKGNKVPTHVNIKSFDRIRPYSLVLLEQIRTIDKARLKGFVNTVDNDDMEKINKAICISLNIEAKI